MSFKLTVGRVALAACGMFTNEAIAAFHVDDARLDRAWLYHALPRAARALVTDTAVKGITLNKARLQTLPLDLPTVEEQRRIAAILDTLDDAIRRNEQVIAKLQQMRQGLLHDLLTRGVDEHGGLRPSPRDAPHLYKDSPLGLIPSNWEVHRLIDRITLPTGQLDPRIEPYRSWVLVAPDHVEGRTGRLLAHVTAADQGAISGKYGFSPGDVVYSKIRPYLRKAILADFSGLCSADMYPLRPGPNLNPRYLLAIILGEHFSRFAESVSMRSGFPKINREELAEYLTPFPRRAEQDRVEELLRANDSRLADEERYLAKLRTLKHGLLSDLLTGRVRVSLPAEVSA